MQPWITKRANDAAMNIVNWIHVFPSEIPFLEAFKFIYILKIIKLMRVY